MKKLKKAFMYLLFIIFLASAVLAPSSSSTINWLSKAHADTLYEPLGATSSDSFTLYLNTSMYDTVYWNINESDYDNYVFPVPVGEKIIIGDTVE